MKQRCRGGERSEWPSHRRSESRGSSFMQDSFPGGLLTTAWPWLGFSRPAFPISLTFPAACWPSSKVWTAQIPPSSFCRLRSAACCRDTVFPPPSKKKTRCRAAKCLWLLTGPTGCLPLIACACGCNSQHYGCGYEMYQQALCYSNYGDEQAKCCPSN